MDNSKCEVICEGKVYNIKQMGQSNYYAFSLGKFKKDKATNEWATGYLSCRAEDTLLKGISEKDKVLIKGNFSVNQWKDKGNKVHHDLAVWCNEISKLEQSKESKEEDLMSGFIPEPKAESEDELPF